MKKKPHEYAYDVLSNSEYTKKLLEKIDDSERESVLGALGERIMAKDEFSRGMDELRAKDQGVTAYKGELDSWYSEKLEFLSAGAAAIKELETLKKNPSAPAAGGSQQLQSLENYIKKDELDKIVTERVRQSESIGVAVMSQLGDVISKHHHLFGEPLDTTALIAYAQTKGKPIADAWQELTAEKHQALAEKKAKIERENLRAEIRAELQKEGGHGVYPVGAGEDATSPTLAALGFKKKDGEDSGFGVKAAVDEYYRSQKPS